MYVIFETSFANMSETQTVLQSSKEQSAENIAQSESRRGSQVNQSPIKNLLSRAQSLTQRSQKSNREEDDTASICEFMISLQRLSIRSSRLVSMSCRGTCATTAAG